MAKKWTDEEFKKAFYDKFPDSNIEIIGNYVNANTPIQCICKKCNYKWKPKAWHLLDKGSCANCAGNAKYTEDSFKKKYFEKFPESKIKIIGKYVNAQSTIDCKCSVCGYEWQPRAKHLITGHSCPQCVGNLCYDTESFKEAYYKKHPDSNINIIGTYINAKVPIECTCEKCGYVWTSVAHQLLQGSGCPKCAGNIHYDTESFKKAYYEKYPDSNIEIIGEYIDAITKIEYRCKVCNWKYSITPNSLMNGRRCHKCAGNLKYTTESFKEAYYTKYPKSQIKIVGTYRNSHSNIDCKCDICNREWKPRAAHIMAGIGCPSCSAYKTEKSLGTFLNNLGISYTPQKKFEDCRNINSLPFDYEINDKRFTPFLLEYQGEQHERPIDWAGKGQDWAEKQLISVKEHDKIKYDYCQKTARHLEYIWYYEEDKIQALIDLLRKYIKPEYDLDKILANAKLNKTA